MGDSENPLRRRRLMKCSFCGKSQDRVRKLVAGPDGVAICNECVALCTDILAEDAKAVAGNPSPATPAASGGAAGSSGGSGGLRVREIVRPDLTNVPVAIKPML